MVNTIHLELVSNLSTEGFIAAFWCFKAGRGIKARYILDGPTEHSELAKTT